jgi:Tol biopolymer transport system component
VTYIYQLNFSVIKAIKITAGVFLVLCLVLFPSTVQAQFYQGYQTNFGKNRVQYQDFEWTFYRFKNFDTYFYLGGQEHALYIGRTADRHIQELEKLLDYRLDNRIQFVIYNTLSEYHQSNITLEEETQNNNTGGFTRIVGNRVLLYFDGDHSHFEQQMRAGITQVLIDQLMYGGDIKERFQNAVLLTLPPWYIQGLISYASQEWSVEMDNQLRDAIVSGKFSKFNRLSAQDAQLAGHSMWRYIVNIYGESAISNLLYMSRVNRNIDSGFLFVLGVSLKTLSKNWLKYYQNMYYDTDKNRTLPQGELIVKKPKSNLIYKNLKISPAGDKAAYVTNDIGKHKLYIHDFQKGKRKKILKYGHKSMIEKSDEFYPLIEWHPTGQMLTMIRKKKGNVIMSYYNMDRKKWETLPLFYFDKVLSFSYSPDGQNIVMSAIQKGQSDIFIFNIRTRTYEQVTNDMDDDFYPVYLQDNKSIIFSSNRVNDTIGAQKTEFLPEFNNYDLFIYDYVNKSTVLKRITNTPAANEIKAQPYDSTYFTYLSDANGIYNRYIGALDSVISHIDTTEHYRYIITNLPQSNYVRNIEHHDVNYRKNRYGQIMYHEGRYKMFVSALPPVIHDESINKVNTPYRQHVIDKINYASGARPVTQPTVETTAPVMKLEPMKQDTGKIDINNYVFQSEVNRPRPKKNEIRSSKAGTMPVGSTDTSLVVTQPPAQDILPIQRNYDIAYEANYLVSQLDNSLLNNTYQTFTGGGVYYDPGINGLFKIGISDLMGDYKMTGGVRLSADLASNEYLLSYESLKRRLDKQIVLFRQSRMSTSAFTYLRVHTHEAKYIVKWPFSNILSVRGTIGYRNDRHVFLSTDLRNLEEPNVFTNWGTAKVEYIFDNTINLGVNLYNGSRYKLFAEWFKEIDKPESNIYIVGADFRHYQKVHRQIIWANRFAASTSFGDRKLIYYMGSTDNVIVPVRNFNNDISVDLTQNYAFQAVATNLRGFTQNIRNGNSFALVNSEIRIPLFQYIINRPIRSDFIRNFQVVGFADAGTAWTGSSPYSEDNSLNTQIIQNGPLTISLTRQIEPIVGGYGIGLRSRILGYFVRTDWAWGVEDGEVQKPIFYLSLSLDF